VNGPVLVTGASGNLCGAVVRSLVAAGIPVRACGTDEAALRARLPGVETARLDFLAPATFGPALAGAGAVFLVRPPRLARVGPTLNAFVDAAERRGAGHVVFSSVTGAEGNPLLPHHRVETHLRSSRLPWTILRPGFFAQNLADFYRPDIVRADRILLPAGRGRAAFLDVRDLGDVAAAVFADPAAHHGRAYTLTGPRALGFHEVAALLSAELGRPIRYEPVAIPRYVRHLRRGGLPLAQVLVYTLLHSGLRRGQAEAVDPTLARLLGRAPRTLEQYVHDHRHFWVAGAGVG
jgi:uncharacterized protein YbjT (DUF2867 family)